MAISIYDDVWLHKFVATWKIHRLKLLASFGWPRNDSGTQTLLEEGRWKNIVQGGAHYTFVKRPDTLMISDG